MNYYSLPTIYVKEKSEFFGLPREFIWKNREWIKHVSCSGSRFHVYRYGITWDKKVVISCSEKNCITNAPESIQIEASKLCGIFSNEDSE